MQFPSRFLIPTLLLLTAVTSLHAAPPAEDSHAWCGTTDPTATLIDIAKHEGREAVETELRPEDLFEAAEAFLTGTSAGVWPIESVDDRWIGGEGAPVPGPVSAELRQRFEAITAGEDPAFAHWLTVVEDAA